MQKKYLIGIDLGGTKIIGVLLDKKYQKKALVKKSTRAYLGQESVLNRISELIESLLTDAKISIDQIESIGIGVPGTVNIITQKIITAPNLGWKNVDLKAYLQKKYPCFIHIQNDVNAGIYAEYVFTLERKYAHVVGIFIGTGLGGGIIINGNLYLGADGYAGEIGHTIIHKKGKICNCGNRGCLECYTSKAGLLNEIKHNINLEELAEIKALFNGDNNFVLKSSHIRKLILEHNPYMNRKINKMAKNIAYGMLNIINILNPQAIILGGGVMDALSDIVLPKIMKSLKQKATIIPINHLDIRLAALGDDAVMLGAALLAQETKK